MYSPFLAKTCSSGMQLTMSFNGKILCISQMFIFLSLPVWSETSSCLVPINLMILKLGMYFLSQFNFYQNFKSLLSLLFYTVVCHHICLLFCLEDASFVLRAANMYVYLNLSSQVMPLSEPTYLSFCCKKAAR